MFALLILISDLYVIFLEDKLIEKMLIPIPVPVYIPMPMRMYSAPQPYPLPIPIPIPIPMFIPTATNNTDKLIEDMKVSEEIIIKFVNNT